MMAVTFEATSTEGLSRLGTFETPHGTVQTPALMPVINPNRILVEPNRMRSEMGAQVIITNAYIIKQGDELTETALDEGVHELIGWDGPLVTDSGTFQDYVYGDTELDPHEIVAFQRDIGSDLGTILDVFSTPDRTLDEAREDADETLVRAMDTIDDAGEMAVNLPVQGATYPEVREKAARDMARLNPPGGAVHPIGGVVPIMEDQRYAELFELVLAAQRGLDHGRPVHLFGAGHPQMLPLAVYLGCDLFDSAAYAKFAQDDRLVFPWGTQHLEDLGELACTCPTCREHTVDELAAIEGRDRTRALAVHNLHVTFAEMRRIRQAQRSGRLLELVLERADTHPTLYAVLDVLAEHTDQLEEREPLSQHRAVSLVDHATELHPQRARARERVIRRVQPRGDVVLLDPATRPFTANNTDTVEALRARGAHPYFPSRLGPVPYDVDEAYPFSQCIEPPIGDDVVEAARERLEAIADRWDVDAVDRDEAEQREPTGKPDLLDERIEATLSYQVGAQAAKRVLDGDIDVEVSPKTGRIRTVSVDGEHALSRRPHDGLFTLKLAGARRIHEWLPRPFMRVRVTEDSALFNADGKSVFNKFVLGCQKGLRSGDECLVVDEDDTLVACGRLKVSPAEGLDMASGPAVDVREGIGRDTYEQQT
jgi:7-cyano-7-deazaguanine tRNA-ribosyltransferase